MNNKGQVLFLKFMIGITIIVIALAIAPALKEGVDTARNSNNLDCDNSTISDFDKLGCTSADISLFTFIAGILFIGISAFLIRKLTLK